MPLESAGQLADLLKTKTAEINKRLRADLAPYAGFIPEPVEPAPPPDGPIVGIYRQPDGGYSVAGSGRPRGRGSFGNIRTALEIFVTYLRFHAKDVDDRDAVNMLGELSSFIYNWPSGQAAIRRKRTNNI
jgi:hypothetical protein